MKKHRIIWACLVVAAAVFLVGVFWKRATASGGMWGLIIGFVLGMTRLALKVFPESMDQKILINHLYHAKIEVFKWNAGAVMPFGLYLTENAYLQAYLSSLAPKPSYEQGFFMENASQEQIIGLQHLSVWVYSHLCQSIIFRKKSKKE